MTKNATETRWLLAGASKDAQSVTSEWEPVNRPLIHGVALREARSVPKRNGLVTEFFRADWFDEPSPVGQMFIARLFPGGVSAWHAHAEAVDRLTVVQGSTTLVLYDAREGSPTFGAINEFHLAAERPLLVVVPPRVWHGIQNPSSETSLVANMPDRPYQYADPDHWRVPLDSPEIPYRWSGGPARPAF